MSYRIEFKGRGDETSLIVNDERGENIKVMVFDGKRDTPIDIDGNLYLVGNIKAVVYVPDPKLDNFVAENLRLEDGQPKCVGQYSIQREINLIAKDASLKKTEDNPDGLHWSQLMQDSSWRERVYQQLYEAKTEWCDYKTGSCFCE